MSDVSKITSEDFPKPRQNPGGEPCGECHLKPGETCDICGAVSKTTEAGPFYIVDLRAEWSRKPYVTVWRPNDAGYAYPLPWAGQYDKATVDAGGSYYSTKNDTREWKRFPVPCRIVDGLAIPDPEPEQCPHP